MVAFILLVVGGLNWLLVALFDLDLVQALVGQWPTVAKLVYVLVGLSAIYELVGHKKHCTMCS
jgi:uncharacterized membrane protein YuzA (DUF378 family)